MMMNFPLQSHLMQQHCSSNISSVIHSHSLSLFLATNLRSQVIPPRELSNTTADHIGAGLLDSLEVFLFGCSLEGFVHQLASRFSTLQVIMVGDAAPSNLRTSSHVCSHLQSLGARNGIQILCLFTRCYFHQLVRIIGLHLDHNALTPALYSISRPNMHSNIRDRTQNKMRSLFEKKFRFARGAPPGQPPHFRNGLASLLTGYWEGESDSEPFGVRRMSAVKELLLFFNGDLRSGEWCHYCTGSDWHQDRSAAFRDEPCLEIAKTIRVDFTLEFCHDTGSYIYREFWIWIHTVI